MVAPSSHSGAACPDAGQLAELARGGLTPTERESILSHLETCAECTEVLRLCEPSGVASGASDENGDAITQGLPSAGGGRPPGPGDIIANKYRIDRVLGVGGMGVVMAATHLQLGRTVALKLMLPDAASSPDHAARFLREAQAAAEVQSEHVARVLDVGTLDDGVPFIVMEFLRGSDFARLLRTHGPLPVADVAGYLLQACEAVAEAHALGIVHRDLKPANLFLTTRSDGSPLVKVLDFGISKLTRSSDGAPVVHTKSRTVMGTPLYMSPEQLRSSRSVGPPTDIWSLGCILHELLAGRPAFNAASAEALGALIAAGPAPHVRDERPDVPRALEDVILRCLEKDPAARFASVGELAAALGPFAPADTRVLVARVVRISERPEGSFPFANTHASERPPAFAATGGNFSRSGASVRRGLLRPRALWAVPALLVIGIGVGVVTLRRAPSQAATAPPPTSSSSAAPAAPPPVTRTDPPPPTVATSVDAATPGSTPVVTSAASTARPRLAAKTHAAPTPPSARPAPSAPPDRDLIE